MLLVKMDEESWFQEGLTGQLTDSGQLWHVPPKNKKNKKNEDSQMNLNKET